MITDQDLLQSVVDTLRPLFGRMPAPTVLLTHHPHFEKHSHVAFWLKPNIYIRPDYKDTATWNNLINTSKHELCHAYVNWTGRSTREDAVLFKTNTTSTLPSCKSNVSCFTQFAIKLCPSIVTVKS